MSKKAVFTRRQFVHFAGLGALGIAAGKVTHYKFGQPIAEAGGFVPDVEINLAAVVATQSILAGAETTIWHFQGSVVTGSAENLIPIPNSYLGPIIHLRTGQQVRINFTNNLAEESIVHWHGLHVPHAADGHPSNVIGTGETYVYEFTVLDQAGTYWYHPHPHGRTGPQVIMGMAGLFLISDAAEDAANLPSGEFDRPLVIQDRSFDASNQFVYSTNMQGFLGDTILVNGQPNASQTVKNVAHRLRILNGSNSRIYKLAWADGTLLTVIGTDGGLLTTAVTRDYVVLGPGERIELLVDFSQWAVGSTIELRSLAFSGGGGNSSLPNGSDFLVSTFQITENTTPLPNKVYLPLITNDSAGRATTHANSSPIVQPRSGQPRVADRVWPLYVQQGQWTIDGRTFEMTNVVAKEIVVLGTQEVWEFDNNSPTGMGMRIPHPMHIHGLQFQVVARIAPTNATQLNNWLTVKDGYVDSGNKDTVLVMPGEKVQVAVQFADFTGLFLYHCHNLEHEDMGMMRNYRVDLPA